MQRPGLFYGWLVAATSVTIYFFTNGMTLFVPQNLFPRYIETFGVTEGQVSLTTAISLGLAALVAPAVGALVDRVGVLRVLRTGLVAMALAFSAYPFAATLNQLYVLHAVLALGLSLAGLSVNVVLLSNWFVRRRGAVIGALAAGSSLAGAVLPLAIAPLVTSPGLGWRAGFGTLAVAFWFLAVIPGFAVLRERPADVGAWPDGAAGPVTPPPAAGAAGGPGVSFAAALRAPALYALALGSACLWYAIQSINSQATLYFEQEVGLAPARATLMFALIFWASFAGKFGFGALSDRFAKRRVMLGTSLTLLAGCLLLFEPGDGALELTRDPARLVAFAVVFGLGFGGSFTMIQLVTVETFGQRSLGKILGIVTLIDAVGAAAGTVLTGQLKTATGSYFLPFSLVAGVAVLAVLCVAAIRPVRAAAAGAPGPH